MKTFDLIDGDLLFENGDFVIVDKEKELVQCLEIMMSTYLGEWFLNRDFGFNYHLALEKASSDNIQAEIIRVLGQEPRIVNIVDVKVILDRRQRTCVATYEVEAILVEGEPTVVIKKEVNIHGAY